MISNNMDQAYVEKMKRPKVYMNQAEGIVKEVRGRKAFVLTNRQTMCAECVARGFCHMLGGGKEMLSEAANTIGAKAGDMVKIGIPEGIVTKASIVVYLVPAIGLVGGAALGYSIGKLYSFHLDLSTFIGSLAGIGISILFVRLLSNVLGKKPSYQPEIIKIINPGDPPYRERSPN
jgi:sigma-E factor negative regulatory protein RseC